LLLGSVTERLLRQSFSPVLAIPPSVPAPRKDGAAPFQKVLCPVDFSPASVAALRVAREIGGDDAEALVLHVVELYFGPALGEAAPFDTTEIREQQRERAQAKLEALVPAEARAKTRLETTVVESGGPYREVLRIAEREKSELIVMGVAGRSAVDLLFFGSTANHVVREAACPVLTVRAAPE
ncbi:MAG: universal stress protein, partial [Vicinamibacteria bacterium]